MTNMKRRTLLLAAATAPWATLLAMAPARAATPPAEVAAALPAARLQGNGRLRFLGLHVYDARLWVGTQAVPAADGAWAELPHALELQYARRLVGAQIAERSLQEMQRQTAIAPADAERWLEAMKRLFPDVRAGDRLTGLNEPGRGARFFLNGSERGMVAEPAFARLFFGIWLSPRTSETALRQALLGGG
jgi:hypothetical protein